MKMSKMTKILCMLMVSIMLVGCGSKERMTAKEFRREMENKGFTVADITDSTNDSRFLQVLEAYNDEEKYAFEFYFIEGDENAKALFDSAKGNLEATYSDDETAVIVGKSNEKYGNYSVSVADFYSCVIRVDNTMLYVTSYAEYEEEAKKIIEELGY